MAKKKDIPNVKTGTKKPSKDMLTKLVKSAKKDYSKFSKFMASRENPNSILQKTSEGQKKGFELFREMMTDAQISSDLQTRQKKVSSFGYSIHVPGGNEKDNEQANLLEDMLRPIYDDILGEIQDDIAMGFSVTELEWELVDGKLTVAGVKGWKQEDFTFSQDWELLLNTDEGDTKAVPMERVVLSTFMKRKGNRFGQSILTAAFWPWFFKKHSLLFWATFVEKFGQPTVVGKFPAGTDETQQDELLSACQAVQNDMAVIIPEGWAMNLLEAARGGSADTYEKFVKYCDQAISKVILHSVLTSNAVDFGTKAAASVHSDLTDQVIESDARRYMNVINKQVIGRLAEYNFTFTRPPELNIHYTSEDTSKEAAERDQILTDILPVAVDDLRDKYNLSTPDENTIVSHKGWIGTYGDLLKKFKMEAFAGQPVTPGAVEKESEFAAFSAFAEAGDIDDMDRQVMEENDYIDSLFDQNKKLLSNTFDAKAFKKVLNKANSYQEALVQLQLYKSKAAPGIWEKFLTVARLMGEYSAGRQIEIADQLEKDTEFAEGMVELEPGAPFHIGDPDAAIKWFKKKIVVSDGVWNQLTADSKTAAFYVSQVGDLNWINFCKGKMLEALTEGKTFEQYRKELFQVSGSYDFHGSMRTAFQTNMFSALSVQTETALRRVTDRFPYWRYSAVMDGNTRPTHAQMHNFVARYDDTIWSIWSPPNGFNCRCRKTICTAARYGKLKAEWEKKGIDVKSLEPDEGFGVNPFEANFDKLNEFLKYLKINSLNLNKKVREKVAEVEKKTEGANAENMLFSEAA